MDYKEKVIALLNSQELSKEQKEKLENIFPELKKSKDDRIVRCLLNYFNHVRYNGLDLKGTDVDEVIAWLEKQGKKLDANEVTKPRWISVEDELPPMRNEDGMSDKVLTTHSKGGVIYMNRYDYRGNTWVNPLAFNVTHWMPLPQVPVLSNSGNTGKDLKGGEE